jgi:hypothetical protein
VNPEFLDVDDVKRMPWHAAFVANAEARWRNASLGIPARRAGPPRMVQRHGPNVAAEFSEPFEPGTNLGRTEPLSMPFRPHGDRPQVVPAGGRSTDPNGGERDMPGKLAVFVGDHRQRQGVTSAEPFDDPTLSLVAVGISGECGGDDLIDFEFVADRSL